jgi:hypothetical protein
MTWIVILAHFFGGMLLANGVPHFVNGISGRRFPSPFAAPPGRGDSRPVVNVLWGLANFVLGFLLLARVGPFNPALAPDLLAVALGVLFLSVSLALYYGGLRKDG